MTVHRAACRPVAPPPCPVNLTPKCTRAPIRAIEDFSNRRWTDSRAGRGAGIRRIVLFECHWSGSIV
eukprot:scaffold44854_cov33-Tisochrysis_lutea.AAC.3